MKKKYPVSRKENLVVQETDGEILIYDLNENKAFCLNETSALIWNLCNGQSSISEISRSLGKKLNAPTSEGLVWLALEQLKKENLIENEVPVPTEYEGLSRREVIKKIGLSSMVALPIISSLIAPTAITAASACIAVGNTSCNAAMMCCTGLTCVPGMRCCVAGDGTNAVNGTPIGFSENPNPAILCAATPLPNRSAICDDDFSPMCCSGNAARTNNTCFQVPSWECSCVA